MQVSVTVITKNEAPIIRTMLQSVRWASEIIVVDSGSTDGTVEIARESTPKVIHHEFSDFATQKNFADSLATCDWILNLDADEICTDDLAQEIQQLNGDDFAAYFISRRNYFNNRWIRHCGWSPDYKLRLYRRTAGTWKGRVHESIRIEGPAKTRKLKGEILHYTVRNFDWYLSSIHLYSQLAAEQMREQGRTAGILDLLVRPPIAFLQKYFLLLGFLDGVPGFLISMFSAYGIFIRYCFLYQLMDGRNPISAVSARDEDRSY
jgi:glycosyltransferase involved in cell wall biosynthesis